MELLKGQRVRNFFEIEARTLLDRYKVLETLLPHSSTKGAAHRGEEGRFIESLLRAFLNKHLPQNLRAVSGFILCPSTKTGIQNLERLAAKEDRHSTQLDIIVYDIDGYPVFERFEEFCIVPPEGVIGIVSVKKKLYNADIVGEIAALQEAAALCREPEKANRKPDEPKRRRLGRRVWRRKDEMLGGEFVTPIASEQCAAPCGRPP